MSISTASTHLESCRKTYGGMRVTHSFFLHNLFLLLSVYQVPSEILPFFYSPALTCLKGQANKQKTPKGRRSLKRDTQTQIPSTVVTVNGALEVLYNIQRKYASENWSH